MSKIVFLLLLVLLGSACRRPCGFYDEVEQIPVIATAELAGVYKPDKGTVNLLKNGGQESGKYGHIVLTQNQEFILVNTPGLFVSESRNKTISDTGRFSMALDSVSWTQEISVRYQAGGPLEGRGDGQIRVYKKDGKLVLFKYVNDPDQCEYMLYVKQ